ncbi:MAG: MFS transporter [Firmicutes bacterium]|nr:MFS transporter [Bacillota bacterium]
MTRPETVVPKVRISQVLILVALGAFMAALDSNIVNLALPTIENALHVPVAFVGWVSSLYLLVLTSTYSISGRLSDRGGHKRLYLAGFLLFMVGSALAGVAWGIVPLLVARAVQAMGGSMATVNGIALIRLYLPHEKVSLGFGLWEGAVSMAMLLGPIVGGVVVSYWGWRWIFYLNAPISLAAMLLGLVWLPRDEGHGSSAPFDLLGSLSLLSGLALIVGAVTVASVQGINGVLGGAVLVGLIILGAFGKIEHRHPAPVIDLALFRDPAFLTAALSKIFAYGTLFAMMFSLPFFLEHLVRLSPALAGRNMVPVPMGMALGSLASAWIVSRTSPRGLSVLGMMLAVAGGFGLLTQATAALGWPFFLSMAFVALGLGLYITPNDTLILQHIPSSKAGMAGGIVAMMRSLGMIFGVTLASVLLEVHHGVRWDSSVFAYRPVFLVVTASSFVGMGFTAASAWFARPIAKTLSDSQEGALGDG